ncbi:MAG: nicotinate (nicotinamide) nucleotide adenylyltransferase [Kiritimatiellae bacterium]|nr:nicotinate (nicotinamide) nucleotide adenylyltransferase [Kiritimatiellia bacterium]
MDRRIGVLGGTFNPVHIGHLVLAQDALEQFELEQVLLMPCATPPHKSAQGLLDARHRVAMLELAVEGDPRLDVCTIEVERGGVSYSVDSVRELKRIYPDAGIVLVIGADTLAELHSWREVGALLELCTVITFERPGFERAALRRETLRLPEPWPDRLLEKVVRGHLVGISSSEVRMRVAEGMSIQYLVPAAVGMYIYEHGLYKT